MHAKFGKIEVSLREIRDEVKEERRHSDCGDLGEKFHNTGIYLDALILLNIAEDTRIFATLNKTPM